MSKNINEQELCDYFINNNVTLRTTSKKFGIDHHRVKRILEKHNINSLRHIRRVMSKEHKQKLTGLKRSEETKEKIRISARGRVPYNKGVIASDQYKRNAMTTKLQLPQGYFDEFTEYEKLLFLSATYTRNVIKYNEINLDRKTFINNFYYNNYFNEIYIRWNENKNKWYRPTLDHIIPLYRGGSWNLENLQFLTWFENRTKEAMTDEEWKQFCNDTNTKSNLFRRN